MKTQVGPWSRDKYGHIVDGSGADVLFRGVTTMASGESDRIAIAEANTDLAACAPELLAALKACAAVCAGETSSKSGLINALELARSAMQKAKGESS